MKIAMFERSSCLHFRAISYLLDLLYLFRVAQGPKSKDCNLLIEDMEI